MNPIKEYGVEAGINASKFLSVLNRRLENSPHVGGNEFSIADITTMCSIDFGRVVDVRIKEEHTALTEWYNRVSARPSAKA